MKGAVKMSAGNAANSGQMKRLESYMEMGKEFFGGKFEAAKKLAADRAFQVTAASGTGGAVVFGTGGAATGFVAGGAIGGLVGIVPALFTFGLSIPLGAAIGCGCGCVVGAATVGTVGAAGGSAAGYGAYTRRAEIAAFSAKVRTKVAAVSSALKESAVSFVEHTKKHVATVYASILEKTQQAAKSTKDKSVEVISDKTFQMTAGSATGGAVVLGTGGGAMGVVTGGAIGGAIGFIPAIFTFGLSIPIGAVIGAGCGGAAGTVVGGATGFVGGGATGYSYTKRDKIKAGAADLLTKAKDCTKYVKDTVSSKLKAA